MIQLCPFCGHNLSYPLQDGFAQCKHCSRVFDSCPFNRLLSAGWLIRRKNYDNVYQLVRDGMTEEEAEIALECILDEEMSHEEFFQELKLRNVSEKYSCSNEQT